MDHILKTAALGHAEVLETLSYSSYALEVYI